jgi:hypothetical protein
MKHNSVMFHGAEGYRENLMEKVSGEKKQPHTYSGYRTETVFKAGL